LIIRKTTEADFDRVMEIYKYARNFMAEHGNPNQWGPTNWPPEPLIHEDIARGLSYVCVHEDTIAAVFCFLWGPQPEPTYESIEGQWTDDSCYGVVHRIASAGKVRGAGTFCLNWAFERCGHLRIDTHKDNYVMQGLLKKLGFVRCGIIYLEDGDPRIAYEKTDPSGRRIFETEGLRVYAHDDVWQSAVCLQEGKHFEPVFPYNRLLMKAFDLNQEIGKVLMIGGGMLTLPAKILSSFPGVCVEAADPDERLSEMAERYFFLDELEERFHVKEEGRLKTFAENGREFLENTDRTYDLIINDAFSGRIPPGDLCTVQAAELIRSRLNENGIYAVNVPGMSSAEESDFLLDLVRTLREVFRYALILRPEQYGQNETENYIVFASDLYDTAEGTLPYSLAHTEVITDRDAPHLQDFYQSLADWTED
jgi:spermidine synthase